MKKILNKSRILLPSNEIDKSKWAILANGSSEYRKAAQRLVGSVPSALEWTLPDMESGENKTNIRKIQNAMRQGMRGINLIPAVDGFVLVERETTSGLRPSVIAALDLEECDLICMPQKAQEESVSKCLQLRAEAPVEFSNATILMNDPGQTVIESLYARRNAMRPLYSFDLMMNSGHIRAWAVEDADADSLTRAFAAIGSVVQSAFLLEEGACALEAAKRHWEIIRSTVPVRARENHPARYALVEVINAANAAVELKPVFRLATGVNPLQIGRAFREYLKKCGIQDMPGEDLIEYTRFAQLSFGFESHPLPILQSFLDEYAAHHPEMRLEYIQNKAEMSRRLAESENAIGFLLRGLQYKELFTLAHKSGTLPANAFKIGQEGDRRLCLEIRKIQ